MVRPSLFILDVSGFLFRAYYALPHMSNSKGESTHALFGFVRSLQKLRKALSTDHMVAVFDGPDNKRGRRKLFEDYKANRTQVVEDLPEQIQRAQEYCSLAGIPYLEIEGVEADDTIGTVAKWAEDQGFDVYIFTSDKDLCQLVTKHVFIVNPWKDNLIIDASKVSEIHGVTPSQIVDLLALMGDSSDNIPGIRGIGPKTAVSLLNEHGSLEAILTHPEKIKGAKKQQLIQEFADDARLSQELARIDCHLSLPLPKDHFALHSPQLEPLQAFFQKLELRSLAKELGEVPSQKIEEKVLYHLVDTPESLDSLLKKLASCTECAIDTETTSLNSMEALLVGIGFAFSTHEAFYLPFNGPFAPEKLISLLQPLMTPIHWIGHNIKYDMHVLENCGLPLKHIAFDTILASYLLHSGEGRHSLDALSLKYFDKVKTPIKELIGTGKNQKCMSEVPLEIIAPYCCEDVDYTLRLKELFESEIKKLGLSALLFNVEIPLTIILKDMERFGVAINIPYLKTLAEKLKKDLDVVKKEIIELAGVSFNLNSPKQLSFILFEHLKIPPLKKTKEGFSTRAEVLEQLAPNYPIAEKILLFRSLDKLLSTYLEALPNYLHPETGRIHPTFNQFITATGRLACQDPNLQNIPVRSEVGKKIRIAFCPEKENWVYLSADYSQIELRLLAHMSEDEELIRAFNAGEDIHSATASKIFHVPLDKVTAQQRYQAKAINFGIIYGQQAYGLSQELKISPKEAAAFIENYFQKYPKIQSFIDACIEHAQKEGFSLTLIGRRRYIPDIKSKNAIARSAAQRLAVNTPLQGTAADLIKLAMIKVAHSLEEKKMKTRLILQVHDELIFETPQSEISQLEELVNNEMTAVFKLKVPLTIDVKVGKNWGEC